MPTAVLPEVSPQMNQIKPVAPWPHTAALASIFLCLTLAGAFFQRSALKHPQDLASPHVVPIYLSLIALEYGLFAYVKGGLARYRLPVKTLIGGQWDGPRDVLRDIGLGLGLWAIWLGVEKTWSHIFATSHAASIHTFLPGKPVEIVLWIVVSISAGISEEIAFRGYFQRQFGALTGSRWIALWLQAVLFGIGHGYQGAQAMVRIALFGVMFGLLALWRNSLRPGIIAHAWTDILSGLFGI